MRRVEDRVQEAPPRATGGYFDDLELLLDYWGQRARIAQSGDQTVLRANAVNKLLTVAELLGQAPLPVGARDGVDAAERGDGAPASRAAHAAAAESRVKAAEGLQALGAVLLQGAPKDSGACFQASLAALSGNSELDLTDGLRTLQRDAEVVAMKSLASVALDQGHFLECLNASQNVHDLLGDAAVRGNHPSVLFLRAMAELGLKRHADASATIKEMARLSAPRTDGSPAPATKQYVFDCCKAMYFAGEGQEERAVGLFLTFHAGHRGDAALLVEFLHACLERDCPRALLDLLTDEGVVADLKRQENSAHAKTCFDACFDAASSKFKAGKKQDALDLWVAAFAYLDAAGPTGLRARTARCVSMAALALKSYASAKQYVELAEETQPGTASTAYLALKLQLLAGDEPGARRAAERLALCDDVAPDYLLSASQEAEGMGCHATAIACLEKVRDGAEGSEAGRGGGGPPLHLPKILRNLVQVQMHNTGDNWGPIYDNLSRARAHFEAASAREEEPTEEEGSWAHQLQREEEWFANTAWNLGLQAKEGRQWGHVANFLGLALAFLGLLHEQPPQRLKLRLHGALHACAAVCHCSMAGERADMSLVKTSIRTAKGALGRLRGAAAGSTSFDAAALEVDAEVGPLDLEQAAMSIKFFEFTLATHQGDMARQETVLRDLEDAQESYPAEAYLAVASVLQSTPRGAPQAAGLRKLFKAALLKLVQAPQPNLEQVCAVFRELYKLRLGDQDGLEVLREAAALVSSAAEPPRGESVMWIVCMLWNRGVHLGRFENYALAQRYMDAAIELAPRCDLVSKEMLDSLAAYRHEHMPPGPNPCHAQAMALD